ncbi:MAG: response regulator [Gammaproteobacteria bacterium]|nr:MAG: response regulator [Gammaproteobacteria bacterium]
MLENKVYTTGEVANIVGVNFRTVSRWIDKGIMKGYKIPGRGDHRVTEGGLLNFLKENNIPIPGDMIKPKEQKRILVVDDEPEMANAIKRVLIRSGYKVATANNGFQAGLQLQRFTPNLITLDLKMPLVDGHEVIEEVKRNNTSNSIKILVVSGQTKPELERAVEKGADDFLEKPFKNKELLSRIDQLLA